MKSVKDKSIDRMIHIRLPLDLHKDLRHEVAEIDSTIQKWVVNLIERELGRKTKKSSKA